MSVDETQKEIARIERRLDVAQDTMSDTDIRKNYEKLRRLRVQLAELEKKQEKQRVSDEELRETAHDVAGLPEGWQKMKLERKRRLISLCTERIELEKIAAGWLRLTIHWTRYFPSVDFTDVCYICRHLVTHAWCDEELAVLCEHYSMASRAWLQEQLPERTWASIQAIAYQKGLRRLIREENVLPIWMSVIDQKIMHEHDLVLEWPEQRHWWKSVKSVKMHNGNAMLEQYGSYS